jgi:myo-inositol-1(or 4)-monophosphatase
MYPESLDAAAAFGSTVVAEIAALLLRSRGNVRSSTKGRFDVVTEADHAAETHFATSLARTFPDHRMFGEEDVARRAADPAGFCWVLDPLDGTVNFAAGLPVFSTSLALLYEGQPELAWVVDPLHDETFFARRGHGATLDGERLGPPDASVEAAEKLPLGASSELVRLASQRDPRIVEELTSRYGKMRNFGSQALQLCYVAADRLRASINREAKLWDDAAGALIATEAGLRYTTLDGRAVFPVRAGDPAWQGRPIHSLCARPEDHGPLCELLGPLMGERVNGRAGE